MMLWARRAAAILCVCVCMQATTQSQIRYDNSLSVIGGAYAPSGFSTNFCFGAKYSYFFGAGRYFVEAGVLFSTLRSRVLENVSKTEVFDSDRLVTYDFTIAYDATPTGPFPYVAFGVAGINEGGQSAFSGIVGVGKRMMLSGNFGIRYDVRDQFFSQSINNSDEFVAHNLMFTVGAQVYF